MTISHTRDEELIPVPVPAAPPAIVNEGWREEVGVRGSGERGEGGVFVLEKSIILTKSSHPSLHHLPGKVPEVPYD